MLVVVCTWTMRTNSYIYSGPQFFYIKPLLVSALSMVPYPHRPFWILSKVHSFQAQMRQIIYLPSIT